MTGAGVILGSAAYMSPEQAKGRPVDQRADVWAFGAVLYEMLTGRRCFHGDDVSDTFAAILQAAPDWSVLPRDTPAAIKRLLRRSLEKDVRVRLSDMAMVRVELREAESEPTPEVPPQPLVAAAPPRSLLNRMVPYGAAVFVGALVSGTIVWRLLQPVEFPRPVTRFAIELPAALTHGTRPDRDFTRRYTHRVCRKPTPVGPRIGSARHLRDRWN